jgi:hypothetical protein
MAARIMTLILSLSGSSKTFAEEPLAATTTAKWDASNLYKTLDINVSDLLTPSQRDIVNSGFSTFTLFTVSENPTSAVAAQSDTAKEGHQDFRLTCSVKFDTWEERYQIIRIDPAPVLNLVALDYKTWAGECLRIKISNQETLEKLSNGGTLSAVLQIRQSSPDEGVKIKNWLVRQQSGFMQGLYAHMLGDFQFRGLVNISVQVAPRRPLSRESKSAVPNVKKGL